VISICVPLYNYPNKALLEGLIRQIKNARLKHELIVIDDASKKVNRLSAEEFGGDLKYVQLEENVGRSRIRNLFLTYAKYPYLLFLDGDSELISDYFLSRYEEFIEKEKNVAVICGRSVYPKEPPAVDFRLRWLYGSRTESKSAEERNSQPYASFMTNNVILKAEVLKACPFEEKLKGYGHEDTLMGFRLKEMGIALQHFDNPVLNARPDENKLFLSKTTQALSNLLEIHSTTDQSKEFEEHVKILRWLRLAKQLKFNYVFVFLDHVVGNFLKARLEKKGGGLKLFAIWKLMQLTKLDRQSQIKTRKG
jgi:glycosyltransferase involved in cell wall biosynthesis